MMWLREMNVSIPTYSRQAYGSLVFNVMLYPHDSFPMERQLNINKKCLQKTYSDFRTFRKQLLKQLKEDENKCTCQVCCPFLSICNFIKAFQFPMRNPLISFSENALEDRRILLESFLCTIFKQLQNFSPALIEASYRRECKMLHIILAFFDQPETYSTYNKQLSLHGWRNFTTGTSNLEILKIHEKNITDDNSEIPKQHCLSFSNKQLPNLNIREIQVSHSDTVLQDIRQQLISIYGNDIEEVQQSCTSDAQLWKIALYLACKIGNLYAVQILLSSDISVNASLLDGTTGLNIACRMGHIDVVKELIEQKADVNLANHLGITPLISACRNGRKSVVEALLHAGADITRSSIRGTHPLHAAVVAKSLEIIQLLIQNGSEVNMLTKNGTAAIHFAAKLGQDEICQVLLDNGVDIYMKTPNGNTPFAIAITNGYISVANLLMKHAGENIRVI